MRLPDNSRLLPPLAADTDPKELVPEQRLLAAVLERAILDLNSRVSIEKNIRREALAWIHCDADHDWSFLWICQYLDLDPKWLRGLAQRTYFNDGAIPRFTVDRRGGDKSTLGDAKNTPAPHLRLT